MKSVKDTINGVIDEIGKVVVGYDDAKRKVVYAMFADQHVLLESVPGLAKTLLVESLQRVVADSTSSRIQMTPDLQPKDITGIRVYNPGTASFEIEHGPCFDINFCLVDEINRAQARTQSALLSIMQERKLTIKGQPFKMRDPFMVLATENPIEQEGTYALPEAQADRFSQKIILNYVSAADELAILNNLALEGRDAWSAITPVLDVKELAEIRDSIRGVYSSEALNQYCVELVRATRPELPEFAKVLRNFGKLKGQIKNGCSPRAQRSLLQLARVRAACEGRNFVLPEDVRDVVFEVLRHRILLSDEARYDEFKADEAIDMIVKTVPIVTGIEHFKKG